MRTQTCGELNLESSGQRVRLCGWVHRRRDFGQLIFIDLRDRYGITQLVFDAETSAATSAKELRHEWTIYIEGKVTQRKENNPNLPTGEIEVHVDVMTIYSRAETPPFEIDDESDTVSEELRLEYRYLDMRRGKILANLQLRHKALLHTRNFLDRRSFLEVQTPILSRSSPEGARDYLVPARVHPGLFYALPQSPQLFKQMLMIGGCDRYFQIAPCFRDEDLRADRQPEFSQIDIEMSFSEKEALFHLSEQLVTHLFWETLRFEIKAPFPRLSHTEALLRFGSDKPDTRFGMELVCLEDLLKDSSCSIFSSAAKESGIIRAITVKGAPFSRKKLDELSSIAKQFGLGGLAWIKKESALKSPLLKFFDEPLQQKLAERLNLEEGDCALIAAGPSKSVLQTLDHLRRSLAKELDLIDPSLYNFLWVIDFPLFEWDEEEERYISPHHPFTAPDGDLDKPLQTLKSAAYDLVCNGYEIAGGSVRIHDCEMQLKVFELLKISQEEAEQKFSALLKALKTGAPPHLGIAFGVERLVMLLAKTDNIRDVIAFPKTTKASDLMMKSPSPVEEKQLKELGIHST